MTSVESIVKKYILIDMLHHSYDVYENSERKDSGDKNINTILRHKKAGRLCMIIFIIITLPINKQDSIKYKEYLFYSIKN